MLTRMDSAVFDSFGDWRAFRLSDEARPVRVIQILHVLCIYHHSRGIFFGQYLCSCNQNNCKTELVLKLPDQAFADLDLKRKKISISRIFGS